MTQIQKVIKCFAMAFAIFLAVGIVSGIVGTLAVLTGISKNSDKTGEMDGITYEEEIDSLEIDLAAVDLKIQNGDAFAVETDSERIVQKQKNGKLIIEENGKKWFGVEHGGSLLITIPEDTTFKGVEIDAGAGNITIDCASLHNLDLDMGVGELNLTAKLTGLCDIDFGVGEADVILLGSENDYRICLNKGIGKATLEGESMKNDTYYGDGANLLEMDGGIGTVTIDFRAEDQSI